VLAIRTFRSEDLEALYAISLATGHAGADASHLHNDGRLIGHIYSAPYALLEPRFALVVEDNQGVAGFAVGTPDTEKWQKRLEAEWWPKLRQQLCRSQRQAAERMVCRRAPRARHSSPAAFPSTSRRTLSRASPFESVRASPGARRRNAAVLGVDDPCLATRSGSGACRRQQCECESRPILVEARV
jgi:hypothetical protein